MRCLTLADALSSKGARCQFICREHHGHLIEKIRSKGYDVHGLPVGREADTDLAHSLWLGASQTEDAQACVSVLAQLRPDWLVVDHYALDIRWETALSVHCDRMMVIDDLADRRHDCNLLLDQNFGSSTMRYAGLVPSNCQQFHGPKYALLNPAYADWRATRGRKNDVIGRVMVYFGGGADPADLAGMALRALSHEALTSFEVDVVMGAVSAHRQTLEALATQRGRVTLHTSLPDLVGVMANADMAIGAGGATMWERCCMSLPSLVISIAENQRPACKALADENLIEYLGHVDCVQADSMTDAILRFRNDFARLERRRQACGALVDGMGVERVVAFLLP